MSSNSLRVHTRWMMKSDLPEVVEIEDRCFWHRWTEEDLLVMCRQRNCIPMVAEHAGEVVGYMIYQLGKNRLCLMRLAVHPDWQRRTIGTQLLERLVSKLSPHRRTHITAAVPDDLLPAHLLFKATGFRCDGIGWGRGIDPDFYHFSYRPPSCELPEELPLEMEV